MTVPGLGDGSWGALGCDMEDEVMERPGILGMMVFRPSCLCLQTDSLKVRPLHRVFRLSLCSHRRLHLRKGLLQGAPKTGRGTQGTAERLCLLVSCSKINVLCPNPKALALSIWTSKGEEAPPLSRSELFPAPPRGLLLGSAACFFLQGDSAYDTPSF